jgi:hypothetical protein
MVGSSNRFTYIKTICDAISQAFYSWELKEDDDNDSIGKITLDPYAEKTT